MTSPDNHDLNYYRQGQYPPNDSEKYYAGIKFTDEEHLFLFQYIGQNNIEGLYATIYEYFVKQNSIYQGENVEEALFNQEEKRLFVQHLSNGSIVPRDKWELFFDIMVKIKEGISKDNLLQEKLQEYLDVTKIQKLLAKHDIKNKLRKEITTSEKSEIEEIMNPDQENRAIFIRNFILRYNLKNNLTKKEGTVLFMIIDGLLGKVISESK